MTAFRRSAAFPAFVLMAAMIAALLATSVFYVWSERIHVIESAKDKGVRLLVAAEEHTRRVIESGDMALQKAGEALVEGDWSDETTAARMNAYLARMTDELPYVKSVWLTDRSGLVRFASQAVADGDADISDCSYFKAVAGKPSGGLYIGAPEMCDPAGPDVFPLARPVIDAKGRLKGVGILWVRSTYFNVFYRSLGIGANGSMGLLHTDGIALAREPYKPGVVGRSVTSSKMYERLAAGETEGVEVSVSPVDGTRRYGAFRQLEGLPAMVYVAQAEDDILQAWWDKLTLIGAVGGVAFLLIVALGAVLIERIRRETAAQTALAEQTEQLRQANNELERFAYATSHDLQEPLNTVSRYVQLLQQRYADVLGPEAADYASFAVTGTQRMRTLVGDLRNYLNLFRSTPVYETVDLNVVLARAAEIAVSGSDVDSRAVTIASDLPSLTADKARLIQVFQILIGNGLKYRKPGQPPSVSVSTVRVRDTVRIAVSDTGIGIDPQYHEQIFEVFTRLHTTDDYPGTGIGLALCKRIVIHHGGRIEVDSAPGQGATFTVVLPLKR